MSLDRSDWDGLIVDRGNPADPLVIEVPIKPSPRGGSGTFLAADGSGVQWWVKPLNNNQGPRVTVTEAIVGMAGRLVDAPVCETAIVYLPPEISGWEFRPGTVIEPGFAHASRNVSGVQEDRSLLFRDRDDNSKRHVGVIALYDWCWGGDDQWLYAEPEDRQLYSHDHGWYFPETGPDWSVGALESRVDEEHVPPWPTGGLDRDEASRIAVVLRGLTNHEIASSLSAIPSSWPVSDEELSSVGWFLDRRSSAVADRMDVLGGEL